MAPRARSASCSTPPKSPIILDDCVSHDEDAAATTGAGTLPTSLQDESAAAFDKTARRKRSLSADSLDKAAAASAVQVDALGAAVQVPVCEPLEMTISSAPPSPPPSSETPWKSVVTSSAPLPTPFVAISSPPTAPAPLPHQHQHRSAYPISSAAGFVQEASAVYHSLYSFAPYDLSPGFLPLPPPPSSSTTTATSATLASVAPFASSPSGLPEHYPDTFAPFPVPATTTLYYPISSGEPNRLVPSAAGYPLPPPTSSQATMETYLPSPPLSLHEAALFQAGHGRLHLAPGPGPGPIGQQQPMPWPTTTATAPPPRSPPRLVANGFTYPISSSSSPRAHFDPGLQVRAAPPPTVLWSKGALASFGATTKSSTTATTKTSGGANGGGGARRQVHEHGSPDWSALRQQIQAGEHPRSRGTCKFFNPQTGFGYIIDDRAEELATDVFVHFTGIEQSRGFRCLSPGERVEYILTQNSAGRVQALKVVGENGAQLLGLADPVQANRVRDAARKLSPTIDSGGSNSSSSPSSLSGGGGARPRKPRVVPIPPSKLMAPIMAGTTTNALGLIEPVHSD